ncbi:MAG: DUF4124 domain-containing protein [Gammaproteobacteria bacterium]|nr:DUF4124 domain-containing protein [Gammaproteobacteria bacterium]
MFGSNLTRKILWGGVLLLLFCFVGSSAAGQLYRYRDDNGKLVVNSILPPAAAQKGYDILSDSSMRMIKRVPARLTEEQIVERDRQIALEQEQARLRKLQGDKDNTLLATYTTVDDLEMVREGKIETVRASMAVSELSLVNAQERLSEQIGRAAEYERDGRSVPPIVSQKIESIRANIKKHQANLEDGEQQIAEIRAASAQDIARFKMLKGIVDKPDVEGDSSDAGGEVNP